MCKTSADIAYIRVSSTDQNTDRQLDGLTFDRVFTDKCSGKDTNRPALTDCLAFLRDGDTLHVHSIDRLARSLADLQKIVDDLTHRGISVKFHKENITFGSDAASPMNKLLFQLLGAVAEFERNMIRERQREGIAIAKAKGVYKGRKPTLTAEMKATIRTRRAAGERARLLAEEYGVTTETIYAACRPA